MNSKSAFSLLELILALFIGSIVVISSFSLSKNLQESQIVNERLAILKLDMNSTKIFIEKNLAKKELLRYDGKTLYFNNRTLLENVSSFKSSSSSNIFTIDIILDKKIAQTWKFKL